MTRPRSSGHPVMPAAVGAVLSKVASDRGAVPGAAAMTGSQPWGDPSYSSASWTAGYTAQLAAVTWIGRENPRPIRTADGKAMVGDGLPYKMWRPLLTGLGPAPAPPPRRWSASRRNRTDNG